MIVDLHNMDSHEATGTILSALFTMEEDESIIQIEFIVGKGNTLRTILLNLLDEEGYDYQSSSNLNYGSFFVWRQR